MTVAVTIWNKRIAPVFDCASRALLFDLRDDGFREGGLVDLTPYAADERGGVLRARGVDELICGAISRDAEARVLAEGIAVRSFIAGDVPTVLQARIQGILDREEFFMPGCGRTRGFRGRGRNRCRGNPAANCWE